MSVRFPSTLCQQTEVMKSLLCVTNLSGTIVKANADFLALIQYDESELIGKSITELIHPKDVGGANYIRKETIPTLPNWRLQWRNKNGKALSIQWQSTVDLDQGLIYHLSSDLPRVTSFDREAFEKQNYLLQILAESSHVGITLSTPDRKLLYVNPAFANLVGYKAEELQGLDWNVFTHHYDEENTQKKYQQVVRGNKEVVHIKQRCFHQSGETVWTSMLLSKIWDESSQQDVIISLITQVSEEEKLELSLQKLNLILDSRVKMLNQRTSDLEKVNRQLEQFVYVASHDLQEPLRTVTSYLGLLMEEKEEMLDEEGKQYVARITKAGKRLHVLLTDLLHYSRVGKNQQVEVLDFGEMVAAAIEDLHIPIKESGARIEVGELPCLLGSKKDIRILFHNLINNAIKFRKKDESPLIKIQAEKRENGYTFSISDNGIGIKEKHIPKIFTIFQRLHHQGEYEGTGIGLALCKRIISANKGSIWVESEPDKGTTFFFTLSSNQSK